MDKTLELLRQIQRGEIAPEEALLSFKKQPFEDLGYVNIDHHRELRHGIPEVIFGGGKTAEQIIGIIESMRSRGYEFILTTRLDEQKAAEISAVLPIDYDPVSKIAVYGTLREPDTEGVIVVCCAGTSDIPVAEEAARTAEALGSRVVRIFDIGVAGMHRLLSRLDTIMQARVIIACAGMEGALATVLGGLVSAPVIAVPTSIGYGASFDGLAALLSMLNSCAGNVSVVNIDNGFGAGYLASLINRIGEK